MKKIYCLLAFTISLLAVSCRGGSDTAPVSDSTAEKQALAAIPCSANTYGTNETDLHYGNLQDDPNVYLYTKFEKGKGIINFRDHFKYQNNAAELTNPMFKMAYATFKDIFDLLNQLRPAGIDHIAVRFHYGLQNGSMDLILQPIFLTRVAGDNCEEYAQEEVNLFYSMKQKKGIGRTEMEQLTKSYRDNVYIKHIDSRDITNTHFIDDTDFFHGDTRYALTPFQQIFKMHCDNNGTGADSISFQIVADSFYRTNGAKVYNFKLHVVSFIEDKLLDNPDRPGSFLGFTADFDQMCPPKCSANLRLNYYVWMNEAQCTTANIATESFNKSKVINIEIPK